MGEKWIKENPEKMLKISRKWKLEHREENMAYNRAYVKKNYKKRNKSKYRKYELKKKYGLTLEDYNQIFAEQNGKCAICGTHQTELKRPLHVDHCHKTNRVRGLLCSNCNTGIGLFQEDIENLRCAILYLNK